MYIIDADKLLELVEAGMLHSKMCMDTNPVDSNGEYNGIADVTMHLDLFTFNQLKIIRDYILENRFLKNNYED